MVSSLIRTVLPMGDSSAPVSNTNATPAVPVCERGHAGWTLSATGPSRVELPGAHRGL